MGKNFGAKQFKGELKAAMQTAATEDGQIFLLLEDHNFTDPQFLDMVGTWQLFKPSNVKITEAVHQNSAHLTRNTNALVEGRQSERATERERERVRDRERKIMK